MSVEPHKSYNKLCADSILNSSMSETICHCHKYYFTKPQHVYQWGGGGLGANTLMASFYKVKQVAAVKLKANVSSVSPSSEQMVKLRANEGLTLKNGSSMSVTICHCHKYYFTRPQHIYQWGEVGSKHSHGLFLQGERVAAVKLKANVSSVSPSSEQMVKLKANEGLTLKNGSFQFLYVGQFNSFSTEVINPKFCF